MKITALSDPHGILPTIPDCDLLLLGGDICPDDDWLGQLAWLNSVFRDWLNDLKERGIPVIGIAGNHDLIFEYSPHLVPQLPWTYLQDSQTEFNGLKIFGTPWVLPYGFWSFMREEEFLRERFSAIPDDTDIVISHGPPYGYLDVCQKMITEDTEHLWPVSVHTGSHALMETIERVKPKLVLCGHIHQGRGISKHDTTLIVNAASWDHFTDEYRGPLVVDIDLEDKKD